MLLGSSAEVGILKCLFGLSSDQNVFLKSETLFLQLSSVLFMLEIFSECSVN